MASTHGEAGVALRVGKAPRLTLPLMLRMKPKASLSTADSFEIDQLSKRRSAYSTASFKICGNIIDTLTHAAHAEVRRDSSYNAHVGEGDFISLWRLVKRIVQGTGDTTEAKKLAARNELQALHLTRGGDITSYVEKFELAVDKCTALGIIHDDRQLADTLLYSLTDEHLQVIEDIKGGVSRGGKPVPTGYQQTRDYLLEYVKTRTTLKAALHRGSGQERAFTITETDVNRKRKPAAEPTSKQGEGCSYCLQHPEQCKNRNSYLTHEAKDCFKNPGSSKYRPVKPRKEQPHINNANSIVQGRAGTATKDTAIFASDPTERSRLMETAMLLLKAAHRPDSDAAANEGTHRQRGFLSLQAAGRTNNDRGAEDALLFRGWIGLMKSIEVQEETAAAEDVDSEDEEVDEHKMFVLSNDHQQLRRADDDGKAPRTNGDDQSGAAAEHGADKEPILDTGCTATTLRGAQARAVRNKRPTSQTIRMEGIAGSTRITSCGEHPVLGHVLLFDDDSLHTESLISFTQLKATHRLEYLGEEDQFVAFDRTDPHTPPLIFGKADGADTGDRLYRLVSPPRALDLTRSEDGRDEKQSFC